MGTKRVGLARVEALIENLKRDLDLTGATLSQVAAQSQAVNLVADAADDITVTSLEAGKAYHFGTATGAFGAADGNNAMTFKLPTPTNVGERIEILLTNAANVAKLVGFSVTVPASQTIRYCAIDHGGGAGVVEQAVTTAGVNGTADTMVKIAVNTLKLGDRIECIALSTGATAVWQMYIHSIHSQLGAGDIAPDPGHADGHID